MSSHFTNPSPHSARYDGSGSENTHSPGSHHSSRDYAATPPSTDRSATGVSPTATTATDDVLYHVDAALRGNRNGSGGDRYPYTVFSGTTTVPSGLTPPSAPVTIAPLPISQQQQDQLLLRSIRALPSSSDAAANLTLLRQHQLPLTLEGMLGVASSATGSGGQQATWPTTEHHIRHVDAGVLERGLAHVMDYVDAAIAADTAVSRSSGDAAPVGVVGVAAVATAGYDGSFLPAQDRAAAPALPPPGSVSAGVPVPTLPPSSTTATMETITTHAGSGSGATASGGGRRYRVKDDVTAGVVPGSHGAAVAMPAAAATSATSVRAMPSLGDIVLPPSGSAAVNPQSLYAALAALGPGPEPPASGRAPPLPSVSTLLQSSRS